MQPYLQTLQPYLTTFLANLTSTFNIPSSTFDPNRRNANVNANANPNIPSFIPGMLRYALSSSWSPFASVPSTIFNTILNNMGGASSSSSSSSRYRRSGGGRGRGRSRQDDSTEKLLDYQTIIVMLVTGYISLRVINFFRRLVMSWVWMFVKVGFWVAVLGTGAMWLTNGDVVNDLLSMFIGTNAGGGGGGSDARWRDQARPNGYES